MKTICKIGISLIFLLLATPQSFAGFSLTIDGMNRCNSISVFVMEASDYSVTQLQEEQIMYYLVDGKEMTSKEVDKLKMDEIEQIEYIKEKEKIREYTKENVDVVVLITMKKPNSEADTLQ